MSAEYINHTLCMSWPQICRIACAAMIRNMTLDEFTAQALASYIASRPIPQGKK